MTMTISGDGTIGGLVAGGLPNATVVQADLAANVAGTGPAFSAYLGSNQTVSNATFTKLQANTKEFDTNSNYDASTNYRFTPTVAGYYQVNGGVQFGGYTNYTEMLISIYKNGSEFKRGGYIGISTGSTYGQHVNVSALIYMNGSTDYIELYGYINGSIGTPTASSTPPLTYFQASMVRSA